jgi:hypothetical protein
VDLSKRDNELPGLSSSAFVPVEGEEINMDSRQRQSGMTLRGAWADGLMEIAAAPEEPHNDGN